MFIKHYIIKPRNWYTHNKTIIVSSYYPMHTPGMGTTFASSLPQRGCNRYFIGRVHVPTPVLFPVMVTVVRYI